MGLKLPNINFFILTISILAAGCNKSENYIKTEGMIWNTMYHITYEGPESLCDSILPVLNEVSSSLSVFEDNSVVSQLNRSDSLQVDSHFIKVYEASKRINKLSDGNFDPTVSPLVDAWGFGKGHKASTDTLAVDSLLEFVGISKTRRIDDIIIKDDLRLQFNFSAIAKGYGCDAVGEMFRRNGVNDYMVEIGGEIVLSGKSPSGKDWNIGIDSPVDGNNPGEQTALVISLTDCGIATSGNYRNFTIEGATKRAHTISPVTGRPFLSEILSATVIAPTCMEADAIATACMASPVADAKKLLEETGVEGSLIFADSVYMTPGFKKYLNP